jgi:rare lipoprotein A
MSKRNDRAIRNRAGGLVPHWLPRRSRLAGGLGGLCLLALLGGCASGGGDREAGSTEAIDPGGIPDAVPRVEPRSKYGNMDSYSVKGRTYRTKESSDGYVERGLASWYGRQFHGRKTSSGERYDMYSMTAAHKTLPLPTYVRVTNVDSGRSAVVKVNDRGPFHGPRVIDLSYAAATKLGVVAKGTALVEVRAIDPARPGSDPGPLLAATYARTPEPKSERILARNEPVPKRRESSPRHEPAPVQERAVESALAAMGAEPVAKPAVQTVAKREARPETRPETGPATRSPEPPAPKPVLVQAERPVPAVAVRAAAPKGDAGAKGLYLQVGAFGDPTNAERLRKRLNPLLAGQVRVQSASAEGPKLYKVRIGPLSSEGEANRLQAKLVTLGVESPRRVWN